VSGPPPAFPIEECGLTSKQVWNIALGELRDTPEFGRAGAETWLRDTHLIGRSASGGLVVGVGNALALRRLDGHYRAAIERVLGRILGVTLPVDIADYRTWQPPDQTRTA
jgi:glycine cleavage system aminomethyltransferase T